MLYRDPSGNIFIRLLADRGGHMATDSAISARHWEGPGDSMPVVEEIFR